MHLLHGHILQPLGAATAVFTTQSWPHAPLQTDLGLNERLRAVDPKYPRDNDKSKAPVFLPGQSTEPPPEAQYQQEFYRCVLETTLGHVRVTPEFASAKNAKVTGRIDLLFQSQNGGLRSLETEALLAPRGQDACFQDNGVYGAWMKSGIMDDYIFLDFCRAVPKQPHPSTASGLSLPPLLICFQILRICFTLCLMTNIKPPRSTTKMSNS